jgi:acyl carrier protein
MTRLEILQQLITLARRVFDEDEVSFDESTPFEAIDDWDSANHVHMVVAMEKAFAIRFDLASLQRLHKVADLVDIIEQRRALRAS